LRRYAKQKDVKALQVIAHPSVALQMIGEDGELADDLQKSLGKALFVVCANRVSPENFRVEQGNTQEFRKNYSFLKLEKQYVVRPDQIVKAPWGQWVAILQGYPICLTGAPEKVADEGCYIKLVKKNGNLGVGKCVAPDKSTSMD